MRFTKRRIGLTAALTMLTILIGAWLLLMTPVGVRFAAALAARLEPRLRIEAPDGSLSDGVSVALLSWRDGELQVTVHDLNTQWQSRCLWLGRLCVDQVSADRVTVRRPETNRSDAGPVSLPRLGAPRPIAVDSLSLAVVEFVGSAPPVRLLDIQLKADWSDTRLNIAHLQARREDITASLSARVDMEDRFSLQALIEVTIGAEDRVQLKVDGDLQQTLVAARVEGRPTLEAKLQAEPLAEGLPIRGEIVSMAPIVIPVSGQGEIELDELRVELAGNAEAINLSIASTLTTPWLTPGGATAHMSWQTGTLQLHQGSIGAGEGSLEASGTIALDADRHWQLSLISTALSPAAGVLPGDLVVDGTVELTGSWSRSGPALAAKLNLDTRYQGQPGTLSGRLTYEPDGALGIHELSVTIGQNQGQLDGEVAESIDLHVQLDIIELQQLLPEASGQVKADLNLAGTWKHPSLLGTASASNLILAGGRLGRMHLEAGPEAVQLQVSAVESTTVNVDALSLLLNGDGGGHTIEFVSKLARHGELRLDCHGRLSKEWDWRGDCPTVHWRLDDGLDGTWQNQSPINLDWRQTDTALRVSPFCLVNGDSRLCSRAELIADRSAIAGIDLVLEALALDPIAKLVAGVPRLDGAVWAQLQGSWADGQPPRLAGEIRIPQLSIHLPDRPDLPPLAEFHELSGSLKLDHDRLRSSLTMGIGDHARMSGDLQLDDPAHTGTLTGQFKLQDFELDTLAAFDSQIIELDGRVSGSLTLGGELEAPKLSGQFELSDGRFAHQLLPEPLEAISTTLNV